MDDSPDNAPTEFLSRRHQMFPVLTEAEIARIRRFGTLRRCARGERFLGAGEAGDLFAVGDVRSGSVKRVGGAIGEGAAVVAQIHPHLSVRAVVAPVV